MICFGNIVFTKKYIKCRFLIYASLRNATKNAKTKKIVVMFQSLHPCVGCAPDFTAFSCWTFSFNPRIPCGVRLKSNLSWNMRYVSIHTQYINATLYLFILHIKFYCNIKNQMRAVSIKYVTFHDSIKCRRDDMRV